MVGLKRKETDEDGHFYYDSLHSVVWKVPFSGAAPSLFIDKQNPHMLNVIGSKIYYTYYHNRFQINEDGTEDQLTSPIFYRKPKDNTQLIEAILKQIVIERVEFYVVGLSNAPTITFQRDFGMKRLEIGRHVWAYQLAKDKDHALHALTKLLELGMKMSEFQDPDALYVYCYLVN